MRVAGLFAGIGGIELGFDHALGENLDTVLLCESWEPAAAVLSARFPKVPLHPDVRTLRDLPSRLDVLVAGFPCTDLSQAGRTAGIHGDQSGLVAHVFEVLRLAACAGKRLPWLVIENVPNMLALDNGRAMRYLIDQLESLGYRWAYRIVDSRFTGIPQRRRRVLLVASMIEDPRSVLFADEAGARDGSELADDAYGFYWTEGRGGLGWARDAVPTLKGGSTLGIPSPPAVWVPYAEAERRFVTPTIADAEELQGFPRGWTSPAESTGRRNSQRWKLVGNAVTVDVACWLAGRLAAPGPSDRVGSRWDGRGWPSAAWGERGLLCAVEVSEFPTVAPYRHLLQVMDVSAAVPLSPRAATGFWRRLQEGNLGRHPGFREAMCAYVAQTAARAAVAV